MATKTKKRNDKESVYALDEFKSGVTFAQAQTLDKLKADAESYHYEDVKVSRNKDRVVFEAAGRRWPIRPNGVVDPADDAVSAQPAYKAPEKRTDANRVKAARKAAATRRKKAQARSEAAKKAARTRKRNEAKGRK